jgi:hypothetical protein
MLVSILVCCLRDTAVLGERQSGIPRAAVPRQIYSGAIIAFTFCPWSTRTELSMATQD